MCPTPLVCLALVLGASSGTRAQVHPESVRIARVTVYADRAEVVREAKLQLRAGDAEVLVEGIPPGVEADSIRVRAHGTSAAVGAVQIREELGAPEAQGDPVAAEREVQRLSDVLAAVEGENAVDAELRAFLTSMKTVTASSATQSLGDGKVDAKSVGDMYAFVRTSLAELKERELSRAVQRRDLLKQLADAQAALAAARPVASIRSRSAAVQVHADRGGALTLELAYLLPGAAWRPVYRATLDPDGTRVELVREAVVTQMTGESWSGVALTLSTALPARGVEPPSVSPWLVRVAPPTPVEGALGSGYIQHLPVPGRFYQNVVTGAPGVEEMRVTGEPDLLPGQARNATVQVVETAYDVSFVVPTASDVPADGREHRVVLQRTSLPVELSYFVAPGLRAAAFLTATTKLPEGAPLLRGPVRISNGTAYLGTCLVGETAPGAELRLPFGEDGRVKVTRVNLPHERSREGLGDRTQRTTAAFRTRLENLRDGSVRVRVEEAMPVAEDERVKVEPARSTTSGSTEDPDRPGVRRWDLQLAPREVRELETGYDVRWPKEVVLASR
jgi:uncharacterized protein (TIGR02231 family)